MTKDGMKTIYFKVTAEEYSLLREGSYHMNLHELPPRPYTPSSCAKKVVKDFLEGLRKHKQELTEQQGGEDEVLIEMPIVMS